MSNSPFSTQNEELKNSIQTLILLHVSQNKISDLIAEAYKNTPKKWQEEIFYLLNNKLQDEENRKEYLVEELNSDFLESIYDSQIWQKINQLSFEDKLPYLLHHILGWNNEKIALLLDISISEVEILLVSVLKKLSE
ncbi:sigma factor-like helix-turn-helix DNA-binding protein [Bernardetia sp. Wsw4-3y2]|uniref:sigma factor-like helix-turn-helix DNA-binding protein n=1 Tax=Bernardetia sp. Wsw4-3y2 TaxID=3127471 RepID=UPI0030CEBBD3